MSDFIFGVITGVISIFIIADIWNGDLPMREDVCREVSYYYPEIKLMTCKQLEKK